MDSAKPTPPDPIVTSIGSDLGFSQAFICFLMFVSKFSSGFVQISHVLLAVPLKATCTKPEDVTDACDDKCEEHEYDRSVFEENIITEWDLICDKKSYASWSQTILMLGIMLGGMAFGNLADMFGRRYTFLTACMINLIAGCLVSVAPNFYIYCFLRFLLAFGTGGMMVVSFVILMEVVGKKYREHMTLLYQVPFATGHALLPLISYFERRWRYYHFTFSAISLSYIPFICLLDESPRWLFVRGKLDRSIGILEKMASKSGNPTEHIRPLIESTYKTVQAQAESSAQSANKKYSMLDLFKTKYLCIKTLAMSMDWLVICLVYYGCTQYVTVISGDIFVNVAAGACLAIPGIISSVFFCKYMGRKSTLIMSNGISAISLLLIVVTPDNWHFALASLGIFGGSITFPVVYLYGGEIFPTVVRNSGIGFCSLLGRIGSMMAPHISNLGGWIPALVFGLFSVLGMVLTMLFLPETRNTPLPETIEDGERAGLANSIFT